MSILSSLNAFIAKPNGLKLKFSMNKESESDGKMKKEESKWKSPPERARQEDKSRPRFAPELDGVYCFETIIPC